MEFTRGSLPNHDLRIQKELNLIRHAQRQPWSLGEPPESLEVAALTIPGDKNSCLVASNLTLGQSNELLPDSCDVVGADNRWVLREEVVLAHGWWTSFDVALGIDVLVE